MSLILLLFLLCLLPTSIQSKINYTIMLDPAGDASHPGRMIDGQHLERGLTLTCAEHIKELIEQKYPHVRVMLTRFPGETVAQLQNATFANRIADLYISLHFCPQKDIRCIDFYYFCTDPHQKQTPQKMGLSLTPLLQVHQQATNLSQKYAQLMATELHTIHGKTVTIHMSPSGIPFAPLKGITCPAFAIEITVSNPHDALVWAKPLSLALEKIIDQAGRGAS